MSNQTSTPAAARKTALFIAPALGAITMGLVDGDMRFVYGGAAIIAAAVAVIAWAAVGVIRDQNTDDAETLERLRAIAPEGATVEFKDR